MAKPKSIFTCSTCQTISPTWLGKCPNCSAWNTFQKSEVIQSSRHSSLRPSAPKAIFTSVSSLSSQKQIQPIPTSISELDLVLGGGLTPGGVFLLSGDPGVGKSTLALQISLAIAKTKPVFFISGEETALQITSRASRLSKVLPQNLHLLAETRLESILQALSDQKPALIIFDSIQTFHSLDLDSAPGSPSQIREVTDQLVTFAKSRNVPILIIGHITKSKNIAGPKTLEHMVDTVLFLEGSRDHSFRLLRSLKNRFGSSDETGVFEMKDIGLISLQNPSEFLLRERVPHSPGAVITTVLEGNRPLLLEIQALTSRSGFGFPKRTASGFDLTRVQLLIGVLTKHAGLNLENQDIFINVVGGMKIHDRAADLAVALAIASSFLGKPLPPDLVAFGEIGLAGEIRSVTNIAKRIKEVTKLGFTKILTPKGLTKNPAVSAIQNIRDAVDRLRQP